MTILTRYPLRLTIPLFLISAVSLLSLYTMIISIERSNAEEEKYGMRSVIADMAELQESINHALLTKNNASITAEIANRGSNENIELLLFADEKDTILYATSLKLIGNPLLSLFSADEIEFSTQARKTGAGKTVLAKDRQSIVAFYPVDIGATAQKLRSAQAGLLFMRYDLSRMKASNRFAIEQQMWQTVLLNSLLFFSLGIILYYALSKRVMTLVDATKKFTAGETSVRADLEGNDEIAQIGAAFDRMVKKISHDQEILKESEERFRSIFDNALDGILLIEAATRKIFLGNKIFYQLLGYREEELREVAIEEIHPPGESSFVQEQFKKALQGEIQLVEGIPVKRKDGSLFYADINASPMTVNGELFLICIFRDITERKLATQEKARLEEQLLHSQKMESIGTLAGGIAHDFNNILTSIIGYGNLALMKMVTSDPQRGYIQNMLEASDRAAHLTKDLLLFSRKQTAEKKTLDLNEVILKGKEFLDRIIGAEIIFQTTFYEGALPLLANDYQLEQVLMNLAINARDAMPGGGTLALSTARVVIDKEFVAAQGFGKPGPYALITVTDSGGGMDETTRERIFDPFFTTKEVGKGTGLGLAVVYGIIKGHDGYINVTSVPGRGSTFWIYLPLIPDGKEGECSEKKESDYGDA